MAALVIGAGILYFANRPPSFSSPPSTGKRHGHEVKQAFGNGMIQTALGKTETKELYGKSIGLFVLLG